MQIRSRSKKAWGSRVAFIQAALGLEELRKAMAENGSYKGAMNLCNLSPFYFPLPAVPFGGVTLDP